MTADALATAPAPARAGRRWRNRDLVATPVIVVVGLVLVLLYTAHRQLDSVERRALDPSYLWAKFLQHIWLAGASTALVIAVALPLGIALSRPAVDRIRSGTLAFSGFMPALPPYGVLIRPAFLLRVRRRNRH